MKINKTSYVIISAVVVLLSMPWAGFGAQLVDRVVAVVNNDIITLSDLDTAIQPYADQIRSRGYSDDRERKMLYNLRDEMLDQLINEKLTEQEIVQANISVSESEIDGMIERLKEVRYYTDEELREALKGQGLSMADYRDRMKDQILRSKLVNREVRSKIVITQEDIKAYYEAHPDLFSGEKKYHLRHIILPLPVLAGSAEKAEIKKRMEAVVAELEAGVPFETLAKTHSQSPLAKDGGNLGTIDEKSLAPQIQSALKNLKKGDHTPILDTDQGFQIFYVEELVEDAGKTLEAVSGEIRETLYKDIVDREFKNWLEGLRKRSHIKIIK